MLPYTAALLTAAAVTQNLTLYRVTPKNYSGVKNMNTGDAAGDAYFAIYEATFPLYCKQMPHDSSCTSTGILNIPNFNVYTEFVVEVDTRFGVYSGCTPNADTGIFQCDPYTGNSEGAHDCWYNSTGPSQTNSFKKSFEHVAGCNYTEAGCLCPAWLTESVGHYPCPECDRHARWHNQTKLWEQLEDVAATLNGSWYSTRAEGKCPVGKRPGSGCWWREVEVRRTVNASCLNERLTFGIRSHFPTCWNGCPQPNNSTSDCYIECLLKSLNGHKQSRSDSISNGTELPHSIPPMTRDQIVSTFTGAFLPVSKGGCPEDYYASGVYL